MFDFDQWERILSGCAEVREGLSKHWDSPKRWQFIRQYYRLMEPMISSGERFSPYGVGLEDHMTPIEAAIWNELRSLGLQFFMQYPVGRRFVDFGDPVMRIAIECDGRAFHSVERDAEKDAELKAHGWKVFRITGSDCLYATRPLSKVLDHYGQSTGKFDWFYRDVEQETY